MVPSVKMRRRLLLVFCAALIALASAEAALRAVGTGHPRFYEFDDILGTRLRPKVSGMWTREGRATVHTNAHGWRDIERSIAKPKNVFRIAVIGDSYVEAMQVEREQSFWSVLEAHLASIVPQRRIEVMGFGVSGFGTGQELLTLQHHVSEFKPDFVILAVTVGNDFDDNVRELQANWRRPFYELDSARNLILDNGFKQDARFVGREAMLENRKTLRSRISRFLVDDLTVGQLLFESYSVWSIRDEWRSGSRRDGFPNGTGQSNWIYSAPSTEVHQRAWDVTTSLIREASRETKNQNVNLLVALISSPTQVHPSPNWRAEFMRQERIERLDYPNQRLLQFAAEERLDMVDLVPPLRAFAEKHQVCVHGFDGGCDGHWNIDGHREAGKYLATAIAEILDTSYSAVAERAVER